MTSSSLTSVNLSCLCGQLRVVVKLPKSALPLPMYICHCDTCRHVSGLLCITPAAIPEESELHVDGEVRKYQTSTELLRCFCGVCGSSVFEDSPKPSRRGICTGALDEAEGIVQIAAHNFVAHSGDGGAREWLRDIPSWEEWEHTSRLIPSDETFTTSAVVPRPAFSATDKLHCECHCGGVQFDITRPNEMSSKLHSPWPDMLMPYYENSSANLDDVKWWLRANGTKYTAGVCACNSCRKGTGYDITTFAFIPKVNIQQTDGSPLDFSRGSLKQYESSKGVYRDFCSVCGAFVFWHDDVRPDLIDVAAGLLRSETGARSEDWLEWHTDRVSFAEFALNKPLIESLKIGLEKWKREK